jgi:hypothetical protein
VNPIDDSPGRPKISSSQPAAISSVTAAAGDMT